jgi:hypothetical protein
MGGGDSAVTAGRRWTPPVRLRIETLAVAAGVAGVGSVGYVLSPDRDVAPVHALRQLDMFYLTSRHRPWTLLGCSSDVRH